VALVSAAVVVFGLALALAAAVFLLAATIAADEVFNLRVYVARFLLLFLISAVIAFCLF
jgi:hypothetical protein